MTATLVSLKKQDDTTKVQPSQNLNQVHQKVWKHFKRLFAKELTARNFKILTFLYSDNSIKSTVLWAESAVQS